MFTRNVLKLLYKLRRNKHFNKQACSVLMILCSLLRHYQSIISAVDQAVIDQITMVIRQIVNPDQFLSQANELLEARDNTSL